MNNHDHHPKAPDVAGRRLMTTREYKRVMGNPSEMKLWRDEQRGIGPVPVRQNGRRYWFSDEVYAYLNQLAASRGRCAEASAAAPKDEEMADDEKSWLTKRLTDP